MRILLDQAVYDQRNKGNVALLQAAVHRLMELWPDAEISVLTEAPYLLKLYCPKVQPVSVHPWHNYTEKRQQFETFHRLIPALVLQLLLDIREEMWHRYPDLMGGGGIRQRVKSLLGRGKPEVGAKAVPNPEEKVDGEEDDEDVNRDLEQAIQKADLVIATGGGYLCDTDKQHTVQVFDTLEMAVKLGKRVAMVGQGVGPMYDAELRARLSMLLPRLDWILIREPKTGRELMESLGVPPERVVMTGDDAVEMSYRARTEKFGDQIGVNLRFARYTEVGQAYIEKIRGVLHRSARKHNARLSLPISSNVREADLEVIRVLLKGYGKVSMSWRRFESPLSVIRKVGKCRLVVTGSYHPAVFALSQGIPVVGLVKSQAYIDKFSALVDEFGPACNLLNLDDPDLHEKLADAIDAAWASAEGVRPHLLQAAARQIEWNRAGYQLLFGLVNARIGSDC